MLKILCCPKDLYQIYKEKVCSANELYHPNLQLIVQSQQWKHQKNVWNLFKANNRTDLAQYFGVSIGDLDQVNPNWDNTWDAKKRYMECIP